MSGSLTPTSDHDSRAKVTRTVAIIKNHALKHRMTIERRIEEASFEIVKERQMEFDDNSDREFLKELFGNGADSLFEGPVWVYVLERRRAVEVWNALMGEEDPERARVNSPNSLRAIYGLHLDQNAVMGSPSTESAEEQISCLFQSSPPFLPQDGLDDVDSLAQRLSLDTQDENGTWDNQEQEHMLSPTSSQLSARLTSSGSKNGTSLTSRTSSAAGARGVSSSGQSNGKTPFKARPIPKTTLTPDIAPRTTKAAALRAGLPVTPSGLKGPRVIPTKEELKQVFLDVPGHKRSSTIQVASTAAPTIAPRMSRAAELRLTKKNGSTPTGNFAPPTKPKPRPSTSADNKKIFEGVPGHKRAESISVASVQAPAVSPRLNKSAALRAKRDSAPPTSFMFRPPVTPKLPGGLSRGSSSSSGLSPLRPSSAMSGSVGSSRPSSSLGTSTSRFSSVGRQAAQSLSRAYSQGDEDKNGSPARVMPPRPPSIEPRTNKSALLRANMKIAGQANAPSSFNGGKKPIMTRRASITA